MWLYTFSYVNLVTLQYIVSCTCNVMVDNVKGDTGNLSEVKNKRQLRLEDYGFIEFLINVEPSQSNIGSYPNDTYLVSNITRTSTDRTNSNINETITKNITKTESGYTPSENLTTTTETVVYTDIFIETGVPTEAVGFSETVTTTEIILTTETTEQTSDTHYAAKTTTDISLTLQPDYTTYKTETNVITTKSNINATMTEESPEVYCDRYKKSNTVFEISKMADVWKIEFYTIPTVLKCFRLHLKQVTTEEQLRYEKIYGDFDGQVRWIDCTLEIRSGASGAVRKHFLQTSQNRFGVMENIIIDEERSVRNVTRVLQEENPDQWLIVKNLLLMRDCQTGDVAVFSRVPSIPSMMDIKQALMEFGETDPVDGTRACEGYVNAWVKGSKEMTYK